MKTSNLNKILTLGLTLAGAVFTYETKADVTVTIEGGSASSSVLFDRATNFFTSSGALTNVIITGGGNVGRFQGYRTGALASYKTITLDINVANGAINGLQALVNQHAYTGDTNVLGQQVVPTFVDSATSPEAVGFSSSTLTALPTYVVPLVFIKNTNSADTAGITNLSRQQAVTLETSSPLQAAFYGGTSTNKVYFVGRNSQAAVRTEIDLVIQNTANIVTYTNFGSTPVLDTSADPGYGAASGVYNAVVALTNAIGTVAVQNVKVGVAPIPYEGVPYSVTNVINGSYPIWAYENYYYITTGTGAPDGPHLDVINAYYAGVTNASFQSSFNPVFKTNYIPNGSLKVSRSVDGGAISLLPGFFQ